MRKYILPINVVTTMEFTKKKVLEYLQGMKDVDIGLLRPPTLPLVIAEVVEIGILRLATIPPVIT